MFSSLLFVVISLPLLDGYRPALGCAVLLVLSSLTIGCGSSPSGPTGL